MAEFPALPLFTDAYLADTRHLTAAQHGAYLLLLMMAWRTSDCALPDDDEKLARWAAMDIRTWRSNKPVIMDFWHKGEDGLWIQKRLSDERKFAEDKRSKNVAAGKASALKRHKTRSTPVQPNGNVNPTNPNPTPKVSKKEDGGSTSDKENPLWFNGKVIRLNKRDYENWNAMYSGTSEQFYSYLDDRDEWYAEKAAPEKKGNWFMATKAHLENMRKVSA